jgi:hypothetical protein
MNPQIAGIKIQKEKKVFPRSGLIDPHEPHPPEVAQNLLILYIIGTIIYLLVIFFLKLYQKNDVISWCVLAIPIIIFGFGIANREYLTKELEDNLFVSSFFTIGILVSIPIFQSMSKDFSGEKRKFICILVTALILSLLAMMDLWVRENHISLLKHAKSVFQTISMTLVIYAMYTFYRDSNKCFFSGMAVSQN